MRNSFDQLAKRIGREALGPSGPTFVHDEISPDAHHADIRHEPDPAREAERAKLGLLGRIAASLCLLEIYGHAPDAREFRACLAKHIAFWEQRTRKARTKKKQRSPPEVPVEPFLWILAAGAPSAVLITLRADRAPGWPNGVYFLGGDVLRVGIVVASELPRERSTLLVRLMAAGPLLPQAIEDLGALPADAHERAVASQILLNLQHALGTKAKPTHEEQEFVVRMLNIVDKLRNEGRSEGVKEGRGEGQLEGVRLALRRVLAARKLPASAADEERIDACADLATLTRWVDQALVAESAEEALRDVLAVKSRPRRRKTARAS